jgi:hypothetical protein
LESSDIPLSRNSTGKSFVCVGPLFLFVIGLDAGQLGMLLEKETFAKLAASFSRRGL